jgi:hypothetical protein
MPVWAGRQDEHRTKGHHVDSQQRGPSVLPLRPLTVGELLDAAVCLLRDNARALIPMAAGLAALEQLALFPLRQAADTDPPLHFPFSLYYDHFAQLWGMLAIGFLTEGMIIALLGGPAAKAAAAAITGRKPAIRDLLMPRGIGFGSIALVATIVGVSYGLASLACWIPWIVAYALLGLAVPAVVIDGKGPFGAVGRSVVLCARGGLRAGGIRLLGYSAWLSIRVAAGLGGFSALSAVLPDSNALLAVSSGLVFVVVNAAGYATIACLDAALLLEVRMRTEGLDIVAFRARRQGQPISLAVPR